MMKRIFVLCCVLAISLVTYADGWIDFEVGYGDPTHAGTNRPRTPIQSPSVYLGNYSLSFNAFEDDCVIQLLDEDDAIVFSDIISAGTTSFLLPTNLEGEYQIQLIYGNFIFTGYIEL